MFTRFLVGMFFLGRIVVAQQLVSNFFYNGPGNGLDKIVDIETDENGFVYVVGVSYGGSATKDDIFVIKYYLDPFGNRRVMWSARFNDTRHNGNNIDIPYDVLTDNAGNVYVCGTTYKYGDIATADYVVLKYSANGTLLWAVLYNGPGNCYDFAYSLGVSQDRSVFVTGGSFGNGTQLDYATVKYNSSGAQQWISRYNGVSGKQDDALSLVLDNQNNVYVTGKSIQDNQGFNIVTLKYNSSGSQQWVRTYNGPGNGDDYPKRILIDRFGNLIIGGTSKGTSTNMDFALIKYSASGSELWNRRYNGSVNGNDSLRGIDVDIFGNIFVTGAVISSNSNSDYATIRYSPDGSQMWLKLFNGGAQDIPSGIKAVNRAYEPESFRKLQVCVTGQTEGNNGKDFYTLVYNGFGELDWGERFNRTGNVNDIPHSIASISNSRLLFVGGESDGDYATCVYNKDVQLPVDFNSLKPSAQNELTVIPNPFNPVTTINFTIKEKTYVKISVFNVQGSLVSVITNREYPVGIHSVIWDASGLSSGIYFYKFEGANNVLAGKLILAR